ncbi:hypothetical protein EVA_08975 [gut metagenome]|uniref:Uncharacterized protein n=1 Tax=gut metagenome TaxID=749906 RepID=J9G7S7_9ZZZZ
MQEESLQTSRQRRLTRTLLTEQIQYRKMPGLPVHDISEQGSQQIAESHPGILPEYSSQLFYKFIQRCTTLVGMYHLTLKLKDFRILAVNLGRSRNVISLVVFIRDDTHFVHFVKLTVLNNAVTERKELLVLIPSQFTDPLRSPCTGIQKLLDAVEFVKLSQPQEITAGTNLLLKVRNGHHFRFLQLNNARFTERIGKTEQTDTVRFIMDMEQRLHYKIGQPDGVIILLTQAEITVVADKQTHLPQCIRLFLLLVHTCGTSLLGIVPYLLDGIPPEPCLPVNLSQLPNTLVIDHLVLHKAKQFSNPADTLSLLS